jgi:putative transcriptional regulator
MRKDLFDQLVASVTQMKENEAGRRKPARVVRGEDLLATEPPDVAALRAHFDLSQSQFAALLGISVDTLQNWEQRRRQPEGPARVLLRVAAAHPEALLSVSKHTVPRRRVRKAAT